VHLIDPATGADMGGFRQQTGVPAAIAADRAGRLLALSDSYSHQVGLWDMTARRQIGTLPGDGEPVTALAFSADGHRLAGGGTGRAVTVWDTGDGALVAALSTGGATTSALAFPASGRLRTVTDGAVMEWSLDPDQVLTTICSGPIGTLTASEWQRYTGTTEVTALLPLSRRVLSGSPPRRRRAV
jgi:WD40 repeat protein